jgi:hypothetical protein
MLFLLLQSWAPGYDELPLRSPQSHCVAVKQTLESLEKEVEAYYWSEEEKRPEDKMQWLCCRVIEFFEPLCPSLKERWGSLALE